MRLRIISGILLCIGLALLCVNIAGFFIPLRHPDIYREEHLFFKDDERLSYIFIWVIPIMLMIPYLLIRRKTGRTGLTV